MECVILFRAPDGSVSFISGDDGDIHVFPNMDAAVEISQRHPVTTAWPFQIVELDEL